MIKDFKDLELEDKDTPETLSDKVRAKLGIGLEEMRKALSDSVKTRAAELVEDMLNIAPMGDYEKLTEDKDEMCSFLSEEAHKEEHWKLNFLEMKDNYIHFSFLNQAIDEGDNFVGSVFVSLSGKIRHAFAFGE